MKYPSSSLGYLSSGLLFQILTFSLKKKEVKNNIACNSLCVCAGFTKYQDVTKCRNIDKKNVKDTHVLNCDT